jgi:hypothetical protein
MELYNLESVYDTEISPLVKQINEICEKYRIPAFMSFKYEMDEERGDGLCTTNLPFDERTPECYIRCHSEVYNRGKAIFTAVAITSVAAPEKGSESALHTTLPAQNAQSSTSGVA